MSEPTPERPRQVTMAGWLIMVGSAFALLLVVDRLSGLHSLETQEAIHDFVSTPPGSELGVSADAAVTAIRTLAMITAGCATAAGLLGFQVLRRSRSARLAVTVLAVPLFVAGMVTGGFITSVVAASAAILWLQPARSWFDGTTPPQRRTASAPASGPPPGPTGPDVRTSQPLPPAPVASARPPTVLWACILTWVCTAVVAIALVASAVVLAISPDRMLDELHRENPELAQQGISDDLLMLLTYLMVAGLVLWCLSAAALAVLVVRRIDWARVVLVVSASTAAALCLIGAAMGAVILLLPLLASACCIALLLRADTRTWFRTTPTGRPSRDAPVPPR